MRKIEELVEDEYIFRKAGKMKKIYVVLSVIMIGLIIVGCSNNDSADNVETNVTEVGEKAEQSDTPETGPQETDPQETDPQQGAQEQPELQKYIDVELVDKEGNVVSISDYEGKFIALNFFGVWCQYCMEEIPDLEKVYSEYAGDDFVLLLVNATTTEKIGKEGVIDWYEKAGLTMPMVLDLEGVALDTYPVSGFPTTYFIDKEGNVLGAITGMLDEATLLNILETYNN